MLATSAIVEAVAAAIESLDLPRVVVDPVMFAKSGHRLLEADAIDVLRAELLPRALLATPNLAEAELLAGMTIHSRGDARKAAARILDLGVGAVIVKGGHLPGPDAIDVLADGHGTIELTAARIETTSTHGTGCTFAAAIAANLALGLEVREAARRAKAYLTGAIRHAPGLGKGHGPLNHFWLDRSTQL
jgi:hydroxymethylpyrimidine/phosphomethylpyrimidine kinase